jgi:glycosyltransferase involved in cell wall biosynthesis
MYLGSLKVALISEEYPPYLIGGAGTVCHDLALSLSKRRIFTTVFSGRSGKLVTERVNDYLEVVRLPCFDFPPRFVWFQLENFFSVSRLLKDYMVLHAVTPEVSPICIYLKKKLTKPLVTSYHGMTRYALKAFFNIPLSSWTVGDFSFHVLGYPLYEIFTRSSLTNSDHIISCSYVILNELRSVYKNLDLERSSVIYNGINFDEIENVEKNCIKTENGNNFTLIYYGRLYWLKGITYIIKAFKLLVHDYPNLNLKIFGEGPLKRNIQALVSDLGLKDKIHVLGQIPRNELLMEIMKADVAVLPSLREAQPLSVLEAMACKKPVVAFNFPFVSEYIKDSYNGLLAKAKDPKDLANKIGILLSDEKFRHRIGENAYKYVKRHHNWNNLVDKYIDVYEKVAHSC